MIYKVDLNKKVAIEDFEKNRDNVVSLKIKVSHEHAISPSKVELNLSKNAMIGLGMELIRASQAAEQGSVVHFYPSKAQ